MLPDPVRRKAEEIAGDRTLGAFPLALRVLETYELLSEPLQKTETVEELHRAMTAAQPWMVAVRNASLLGRQLVVEGRSLRIERLRKRLLRARQKVARGAVEALRGAQTVVTLSYSSDVFEALTHPEAPDGLRVYVCESRPLQEGIPMASDLRQAGVEAVLVADAAGPTLVGRADAVVCGADSLLRGGSLVNKIGTLSLALASREHHVPFLPLLEVLKLELEAQEIRWEEERRDPEELSTQVEALNFYFEEVVPTLLDRVVTDAGTERPVNLLERFRTPEDLAKFYLE
jgi:translation initiation factor eIF-2B subunit delta